MPTENDSVVCPPLAEEPCIPLPDIRSKADADFKAWVRGAIADYKVCRIKQAALIDCINKYNKQ